MNSLDFSMLDPRHAPAREACGIDAAGALAGGDLKTANFPLPPVANVSLNSGGYLSGILSFYPCDYIFSPVQCSWTPSKERLWNM